MIEAEWDACADPWLMARHLRGKTSLRKIRLFDCACCRRRWAHVPEGASRAAVETAERYADGLADADELRSACLAAQWAAHNAALARARPYKTSYAEDGASDAAEEFNIFFPDKGYLSGAGGAAAKAVNVRS
jgi:hypothetical protein